MSMHFEIFTLSEENINHLINDPDVRWLFSHNKEAYIRAKADAECFPIKVPNITLHESELIKFYLLDEKSHEPFDLWNPLTEQIHSYFIEKYNPNIGGIFWLFGIGRSFEYDDTCLSSEAFTPTDIRDAIAYIKPDDFKVIVEEEDIENLQEIGLIRDEKMYDYYSKDRDIISTWIEKNIQYLLKNLRWCVENNVGLVVTLS